MVDSNDHHRCGAPRCRGGGHRQRPALDGTQVAAASDAACQHLAVTDRDQQRVVSEASNSLGSMDAERRPEYLKAVAEAVQEFRYALTDLLELYVPFGTHVARGIAPPVVPHDDADEAEIAVRRSRVARAAGRATEAVGLTNTYIMVAGAGPIDPIAAWSTITEPQPLLEPDNVLGACDSILGRLDAKIRRAEAERPPVIGAASMHPLVWGAARPLWVDGHFRQAISAAAETLIAHVKARTGRYDLVETSLWQQTFSDKAPEQGKPRLRWPGDPAINQDIKNMNDGLRLFAPGVQMLIRNPATHSVDDMPEQDALERLAVLSLLARWVDQCQVEDDASPHP